MFDRLVFQGAEIPSNKTLLMDMGVKVVGVGFKGLRERVKNKENLLANFPDDTVIHAYPGISPENDSMSAEESLSFAKDYESFVEAHSGRLASWTEFDSTVLGPDWVRARRKEFYERFDPWCFRPIWHTDDGRSVLEALSEAYPHVVIPFRSLENQGALSGLLKSLKANYETQFHVMSAMKPENLRQMPLADVYTMTWTTPMMRGETLVWSGNRINRYPKNMKEEARAQHRADILDSGLDFDLISEDKPSEVAKLAIWTLLKFEEQAKAMPNLTVLSNNKPSADLDSGHGESRNDVGNFTEGVRQPNPSVTNKRHPSQMGTIPSIGVETQRSLMPNDDGSQTIKEIPIMTSKQGTIRQCDTCFVSTQCPAFQPQTECAFTFPIEIKTRDQLAAMLQSIVEMQGNRVAFARFTEELNGGYPDVTVSKEIDRLFKLVSTMKKLEQTNESLKISVERQSSSGVLSALFGDRAKVLNDQPDPPQIEQ